MKHGFLARGVGKDAARRQWQDHFNNRRPDESASAREVDIRAASADVTEILIYDEIGFWGITAKTFVRQLSAITTPEIIVRINSPGGDVFDGLTIHNALRAHSAAITTRVEGLAASAASMIAMAGKNVVIEDNALIMCHRAWTFAYGNAGDMRESAGVLDKIDDQLAGIYAAKSGKSREDCAAMMAGPEKEDGTWFTAAEAMDFGLVDKIVGQSSDGEEVAPDNCAHPHIQAMRRRLALCDHAV